MHFTLPVTCIRCGSEVHPVNNADPTGWVNRERRTVITCTRDICGWSGVVIVELVDLTHKRATQ